MTEILVIEDEADLREMICFNLETEGYSVKSAASAEDGLGLAGDSTSLILLDVMLPGMSGLEMASMLRGTMGNNTPIIFLTALGTESDLLNGFRSGGDDYITKPFSYNELFARIAAVLRRSRPENAENEVIELGRLKIYPDKGLALLDGKEIIFSRKEFDLLTLLARNRGNYLSRSAIIDILWKDAPYVIDRTIDVHIARIRAKLGPLHDLIRNKTGFGYYISI